MPTNERIVVVSYDISDDGRRQKASRILCDFGVRVQRSVFECLLSPEHKARLHEKLARLLEKEDSIRYYHLCQECAQKIEAAGRGKELGPEEPPSVIVV
ncbi:MAG: CRISPR-associated endonuclease Cas2 [Thermaerobacter sp.]|nr:CRISPR-associated endonuclease Cas2 [Thermaerobacter sp.]